MNVFRRRLLSTLLAVLGPAIPPAVQADNAAAQVGVVVMHGKASSPHKAVSTLASGLQARGFQVTNLEMPWSGRRAYDVGVQEAEKELTRALAELRAKGAAKVFVAGHSQGALFAVHYAGVHPVDGVVAIAPGGLVDTPGFLKTLGDHVGKARQMVADGRGAEKAGFGDYEGRRGTTHVRTTAASFLSWFDPAGTQTTRAFSRVREGTPLLYVAPTGDYPALARLRDSNFAAVPKHPASRLLEVNADHMGAPAAAAGPVADWIRSVASD